MKVSRRVEEVRAEEVRAELFGEALGYLPNRDAARVRRDDRAGLAKLLDALEEAPLDVEPLDDGLDDDVAVFEPRQVVVEVPHGDERGRALVEERRGLRLLRRLKPRARHAVAHLFRLKGQPLRRLLRGRLLRHDVE